MRQIYTPADWYWIVGDQPAGRVYSSRRRQYVGADDAEYFAWAESRSTTRIDTEDNLKDVLDLAKIGFDAPYEESPDPLTTRLAALEAALIDKGVINKDEIDAKAEAVPIEVKK